MDKRSVLPLFFTVVLLTMVGCVGKQVVNVDGMPISTHEYQLTNSETGIRAVVVLARYYSEDEGNGEKLTKPEYLDLLEFNRIKAEDTVALLVHCKIVNLKKRSYSAGYKIDGPSDIVQRQGRVYSGSLSRKDFFISLPLDKPGVLTYELKFLDENGDDLYDLPPMRYKVKGGVEKTAQNNGSK